jgi:UDP-N-acetylglucosamine--N-acetylmuramyl-(pentapeptide) pyrophosphoryl-undecaprenol N-acetylglucosamine transferase
VLYISSFLGIPTIIQEQNSYAGVTNKILSRRAKSICVAYSDMERYFPQNKIKLTGNPVRKDLSELNVSKEDAIKFFGLTEEKKTILVIGGSLGARTINESIEKGLPELQKKGLQLIWQTGKTFYKRAKEAAEPYGDSVKVFDFINRMNFAYTAADVVISRAGALSISELTVVQKAAVLVPSPNVAEDHQTKNAMALVNKDAAIMVRDDYAAQTLISAVTGLLEDEHKLQSLRDNIGGLAFKDADASITGEILKWVK